MAAVACAELPSGQWGDVISILMHSVTNEQSGEILKEASLEALGYICNDIVSFLLFTEILGLIQNKQKSLTNSLV